MPEEREVTIQEWVGHGSGIMTNVWGLEPSHEFHPYNQVKAQGLTPEDYGIEDPFEEMFKGKTRGDLIREVIHLRKELDVVARMGFY